MDFVAETAIKVMVKVDFIANTEVKVMDFFGCIKVKINIKMKVNVDI